MDLRIETVVTEIADIYGPQAVREALRREWDARRAGRMETAQEMVLAAIMLCRRPD